MSFKTDMDKVLNKVKLQFDKAFDKEFMQELGDETAAQIVKRTRLGKGVDEQGSQQTTLKSVTDEYRDLKKKKGLPYSKKKCQLSATGEMLDSMVATNAKKGSVTITFKGQRNKDIASYHDRLGAGINRILRPFFNVTKGEKNAILRKIRQRIREIGAKLKLK